MIEETIKKIEEAVRRIESMEGKKSTELVALLASLKSEVRALSQTHTEQARSIAGFAEAAAHEASRRDKSPRLLEHSVEGLSLSVEGFETSHPRLVKIVNELCVMLAKIGI